MAQYRVTGPDGSMYEVNAPEDATEAQIMGYVQAQTAPKQGAEPPLVPGAGVPAPPDTRNALERAQSTDNPLGAALKAPDQFMRQYAPGFDYLNAGARYGMDKITGAISGNPGPSFDQQLQGVRRETANARENAPVMSYGSEISGGVTSPIYAMAGKVVGLLADAAKTTPYAKMLLQSGGMGLLGGVTNAEGQGGGVPSLLDLSNSARTGTEFGIAAPVVLKPAIAAAGWGANKVGQGVQLAMDKLPFNQESVAARKIAENLARDNITPAQLQANRQTLGPQSNVVDAAGRVDPETGVWLGGRNIFGQADALANMPGKTADIAEDVLKPRPARAATEVIEAADDHLGSGNFYDDLKALDKAKTAASEPAYRALHEKFDTVQSPMLANLAENDIIQQAAKEGERGAKIAATLRGEKYIPPKTPMFEFDADGNTKIAGAWTMRQWDMTKRGIDRMLNNLRDTTTGQLPKTTEVGDLLDLKTALVSHLDDLTTVDGKSLYAEARKAWAGPSAVQDAMWSGRDFMRGDREVTKTLFDKLSPDEKEAFRIGASREVKGAVEQTGKVPASLKNILNPESKQRKVMREIFPGFNDFVQKLGATVRKGESVKMLGGSQTFGRGEAANDLGIDLGGALIEGVKGNIPGAAGGLVRGGLNWLTRPSEGARNAMGNMLLNPQAFDQTVAALNTRAQLQADPYIMGLLNPRAVNRGLLGVVPKTGGVLSRF